MKKAGIPLPFGGLAGKTWVMRQVVRWLKEQVPEVEVVTLSMQAAGPESKVEAVLGQLITQLKMGFRRDFPTITDWEAVMDLFTDETEIGKYYAKFPSPFVQRRLFNAFARDMFPDIGRLHDPFDGLSDTITALYLQHFFYDYKSRVHPEFPTDNGKIDILVYHGGQQYGLEVKSFASAKGYQEALKHGAPEGDHISRQV